MVVEWAQVETEKRHSHWRACSDCSRLLWLLHHQASASSSLVDHLDVILPTRILDSLFGIDDRARSVNQHR